MQNELGKTTERESGVKQEDLFLVLPLLLHC